MLENTIRSETVYKLKEQDAFQTVLSLIPPNFYYSPYKGSSR